MTCAFLDLASHGIFPLFEFAVADKLSASVTAMDKNYVCPKLDTQDDVRRNVEEFGDFANGEVEVLAGLDESVEHFR